MHIEVSPRACQAPVPEAPGRTYTRSYIPGLGITGMYEVHDHLDKELRRRHHRGLRCSLQCHTEKQTQLLARIHIHWDLKIQRSLRHPARSRWATAPCVCNRGGQGSSLQQCATRVPNTKKKVRHTQLRFCCLCGVMGVAGPVLSSPCNMCTATEAPVSLPWMLA